MINLCNYASPFFQRPYQDLPLLDHRSILTREIDNQTYTVYRPNHGLAFSMIQGFLARDIVYAMKNDQLNNSISRWLLQCNYDTITKIFVLSTFQRSGRESEVPSSLDPDLYNKYEAMDQENFISCSSALINDGVFSSIDEVRQWSSYLRWHNDDSNLVSRIIKAAHHLALRRIPQFDENRIKKNVRETLSLCSWCDYNCENGGSITEKLWERSGLYLGTTGDRYIGTSIEPSLYTYQDKFFTIQQDTNKLYHLLSSI